jgi:phage baseplate assembly protein W
MSGLANTQTIFTKLPIIYSDFVNSFAKAPFTDDLAKVTNISDVKQSIANIIKTVLGERLYDNTIGIPNQTFELDNQVTMNTMIVNIKNALLYNEKRANILQVVVNDNPDGNSFTVTIFFTVINNPQIQNTNVVLIRVR